MSDIKDWSTTAGSNNSASPDGFPENMAPNGVNDSAREVMASVREFYENIEWRDWGHTPTRTGNTTFTVTGDQTAIYKANRRIRCTDSSTLYGTISSSAYTTSTEVTVTLDSGSLSASLSAVALGFDDTNTPITVISNKIVSGTITPSSDADVTLSAEQNKYDRLILADGSWTSAHNIIVDTTERRFFVDNSAGTYVATVKTSAGTGIAVPAGSSMPLICDGTNVVVSRTSDNNPAFSVHMNGTNQTGIVSGVATLISLGTEIFDTNSNWDTATSKFTPTVAGKYLIQFNTIFVTSAADMRSIAYIYKNGSPFKSSTNVASGVIQPSVNVSDIIDFNGTTDYIEFYAAHDATGTRDINGATTETYAAGCRIA